LTLLALVTAAALAAPLTESASAYAGSGAAAVGSGVQRGVRTVSVPKAGRAVTARADRVVGHGTPGSCTSRAVVRAVARGGVIHFSCGSAPVTIPMRHTARVMNTSRRVVIDGGGLVTLSGLGKRRILYLNACDPHNKVRRRNCQTAGRPLLVVQHLGLVRGRSHGTDYDGGGGAIFAYGGQLKVVDSTFVRNRCNHYGPDLGGGAIRARFQADPVYVVHSIFRRGRCSNGAAISGLNVTFRVLNSVFRGNRAIGYGANPARRGTPGGGSGGAIYGDGETYAVRLGGTLMQHNHAREGGGAVFYVSNDRTGHLGIRWSTLTDNVSARFETRPGIFYLGRGPIQTYRSIIR
jgi:hypothetical protein